MVRLTIVSSTILLDVSEKIDGSHESRVNFATPKPTERGTQLDSLSDQLVQLGGNLPPVSRAVCLLVEPCGSTVNNGQYMDNLWIIYG